jgi:hypothetical protein
MAPNTASSESFSRQSNVQNSATRSVASWFGAFAGLLGIEHGLFETLQGNVAPGNIMIHAFGPPCQPDQAWHACEPAMTIIPNLFVTGIIAIIVSCIVVVWAMAFISRKDGGPVLMLLAVLQLLVGGGFIPIPMILIAGAVGAMIYSPLTWWQARFSVRTRRFLATLWPWPMVVYFIVDVGQFIIGSFFNAFMIRFSVLFGVLLPLSLVLLVVLTGFAYDIQHQDDRSEHIQ